MSGTVPSSSLATNDGFNGEAIKLKISKNPVWLHTTIETGFSLASFGFSRTELGD